MIAVADRRLLLPPNIAVPFTPPIVLAKSAVGVSCPADATEDTLATISLPAGAMGPNGQLRVWTQWTVNNNVNAKTARVRLGGGAGTDYLNLNLASVVSFHDCRRIANRNAANSQVGNAGGQGAFSSGAGVVTTSAIDTSAATTIVITGQKGVAGDVLTLESYLVELIYGA